MAKQMTPIIRPLRKGSGTIYTFPSAVEDIGLNLDSTGNRIALSRFAILNLPSSDTSDNDSSANHFNFTNIPGIANLLNGDVKMNEEQKIAIALQNYMMNMETTIVNQDDYDYSANATVSERVFWKFLKETGAIRWKPVGDLSLHGKQIYTEEDESEENGYHRVVQSIGEISGGNSVSGEFGMYNETYVNIPSTYGASKVFFEVVEDSNYRLGEVYTSTEREYLSGRDSESSKETYIGSNVPVYDSISIISDNDQGVISKELESGLPWYQATDQTNNVEYSYFTEEEFDSENGGDINYLMNVVKGDADGQTVRQFLRSRLDGVQIVSDIDNIDNIFDQINSEHPFVSYDSINIDRELIYKENYEFNAILLYYTIYDKDNNNELATNLFGIVFLNSPQVESGSVALNTGDSLKFNLPTYSKKKSNGAGADSYFGNGYSFKVNIRSLSIYDNTDAYIKDETTGASLYTEDFNDVIYNLNKSVETLQKNSVILNNVFNAYTTLTNKVDSLANAVQKLDKKIEELNLRKLRDIESDNILVRQDFESKGKSYFEGILKIDENINYDIPKLDVSTLVSSGFKTQDASITNIETDSVDSKRIWSEYADFKNLKISGNELELNSVSQIMDKASKLINEVEYIPKPTEVEETSYQEVALQMLKLMKVSAYENKQFEIVPDSFDSRDEMLKQYKDSLYQGTLSESNPRFYMNYINFVPVIISALQKISNDVSVLQSK